MQTYEAVWFVQTVCANLLKSEMNCFRRTKRSGCVVKVKIQNNIFGKKRLDITSAQKISVACANS